MTSSSFFKASGGVTTTPWKSHHGSTTVVDFTKAQSVDDTYAAYSCITVLTSNGKIGTLTHLDTTDIDKVDEFIRILNTVAKQDNEPTNVILSGGSSLPESKKLSVKIISTLKENGYMVTGTYLTHKTRAPLAKIACLKQDKVTVKEYRQQDNQDIITEINFVTGKKLCHSEEHVLPSFVNQKSNK